jgi:hypothetical protein
LRNGLVAAGTRNVEQYSLGAVASQYAELYRSIAHV